MKKRVNDSFDRRIPPTPGTPKDVTFPDYFEHRLSNGLKVIVHAQRALPIVSMNLVARGGTVYDGETPGLAAMTAELMIKGTADRSSSEIAEEIESLGGSIASGANWDSCSVGITILSKHSQRAFDVLSDVMRASVFPEEEIERVREQRLADILQDKSSPGALAWRRFCSAVFGRHPYGQPPDGTEQTVAALTRTQVRDFHASRFVPENVFLLVVGDADPADIVTMAERVLGDWQTSKAVDGFIPMPETAARRVQVVDRPNAVQTSVLVGHIGLSRNSDDYIPVFLMNTLFGGYFGSRLNLNLRETRGYTYGAHSRFDARRQPGPFAAGAEVRSETTDHAIEEVLAEMHRMREDLVSAEELDKVKRYVTGSFPLLIETPAQVAQRIISIELYGLEKTYYNHFNSTVLSLTSDDIRGAAQRYLHPDSATIIAAGRGSMLRDRLERFGTVEVFDSDGRLIPNVSFLTQDT